MATLAAAVVPASSLAPSASTAESSRKNVPSTSRSSSTCLQPRNICGSQSSFRRGTSIIQREARRSKRVLVMSAEVENPDQDEPTTPATKAGLLLRTPDLEEKFAVMDTGKWECSSCGYLYDQSKGDPEYPVGPGTAYGDLPEDWRCPTCGAAKSYFKGKSKEVAGFAQNQQFGLGGNSLTSNQKSLIIYGTLAFFFFLFLSGYFLP